MSSYPRVIGSYERIAQQEHCCQRCQSSIRPGESYCGTVYVNKSVQDGKRRSWVFERKYHSSPEDCIDFELDFEIHLEAQADAEREKRTKQAVALVAILAQAKSRRL